MLNKPTGGIVIGSPNYTNIPTPAVCQWTFCSLFHSVTIFNDCPPPPPSGFPRSNMAGKTGFFDADIFHRWHIHSWTSSHAGPLVRQRHLFLIWRPQTFRRAQTLRTLRMAIMRACLDLERELERDRCRLDFFIGESIPEIKATTYPVNEITREEWGGLKAWKSDKNTLTCSSVRSPVGKIEVFPGGGGGGVQLYFLLF